MAAGQKFTCSNPACGKVFVNPVKVQNLSSKKAEPYDACPYCLTEIMVEEEASSIIKEDQEPELKGTEIEEPIVRPTDEKPSHANAKKCAYYFGYLSKRSTKEKIPDDCIVCENIVQCMLKNVTS
jgi:hypothetical protein